MTAEDGPAAAWDMRGATWFRVTLFAVVVGGLLRFYGLSHRDFWFDESCTFSCVQSLFGRSEGAPLFIQGTNLFYYVCLKGWLVLFGDSEAAYRSLSAASTTVAIVVVAHTARRVGGGLAGCICAAIAALHPLHIYYAHEARAYGLWTLTLALALALLVEANRRERWIWWVLYGGAMLLALFAHVFTAYLLPVTVVGAWLAVRRRAALKRWAITTAAVAAIFGPYVLFVVVPVVREGPGAWLVKGWGPATAILHSLSALLPAGDYPMYLHGLSLDSPDTVRLAPDWLAAVSATIPAVLTVLAVAALTVHGLRRGTSRSAWGGGAAPCFVFAAMALLPLVLMLVYSLATAPAYLVGRYDVVAWPAGVVALALILDRFVRLMAGFGWTANAGERPDRVGDGATARHGAIAVALCVLLLACSAVPVLRTVALDPPRTFQRVRAARMATLAGERDIVVALSADKDYLAYYLHRAAFAGRVVSFPSWLDRQIGWYDTESDTSAAMMGAVADDAAERARLVKRVLEGGGQAFLLASFLDPNDTGKRGGIHRVFQDALREVGLTWTMADVDLGVWQIRVQDSAG